LQPLKGLAGASWERARGTGAAAAGERGGDEKRNARAHPDAATGGRIAGVGVPDIVMLCVAQKD
jgi:hypothetical protein